jgi:hypothetical protein
MSRIYQIIQIKMLIKQIYSTSQVQQDLIHQPEESPVFSIQITITIN